MKSAKKLAKTNPDNDLAWSLIISFFSYAMRIRLSSLSKKIRDMIQKETNSPLLTSASIKDAQRVMRNQRGASWANSNSGQYHFEGFALSPNMDSVIARYKFESNMLYLDTLQNVNNKPPIDIEFSVEDVQSFAASRGKLNIQYITFKKRDERQLFITTYLHFSNTQKHPRWHLLKTQSEESLLRLIKSLRRYKDEKFREKAEQMIGEVQLAIQDKKNNLQDNEQDMLGKELNKLKI